MYIKIFISIDRPGLLILTETISSGFLHVLLWNWTIKDLFSYDESVWNVFTKGWMSCHCLIRPDIFVQGNDGCSPQVNIDQEKGA